MTEKLEHTCEPMGDDDPTCLLCDVNSLRDGIATVSLPDAKAAHAALRRIASRLAELVALKAAIEAENEKVF